jgi:hypothetical protein
MNSWKNKYHTLNSITLSENNPIIMATPQIKRPRPPPIKLTIPLLSTDRFAHTSPVDDVMSPGCFIEPYVLTEQQRDVVDKIQQLRKQIQRTTHRDKDDKARVLDDKALFLSSAIVAECYYHTNQDTVLVSCLTHREGRSQESRPDSIFAYDVKDCERIKILRKLDTITAWIDKQINADKTVILHCYAGINRSASIALAYHCLKTGNDIIAGFKYLAEQRPGILSNTKFIEQLVIWADSRGLMPTDM